MNNVWESWQSNAIFTSIKTVVGRFVCQQDYTWTSEQISTKLKDPINFWIRIKGHFFLTLCELCARFSSDIFLSLFQWIISGSVINLWAWFDVSDCGYAGTGGLNFRLIEGYWVWCRIWCTLHVHCLEVTSGFLIGHIRFLPTGTKCRSTII